ncbi:MAG: hypothetical protein ABIG67_08735 [Pseudomonadota bacterium]
MSRAIHRRTIRWVAVTLILHLVSVGVVQAEMPCQDLCGCCGKSRVPLENPNIVYSDSPRDGFSHHVAGVHHRGHDYAFFMEHSLRDIKSLGTMMVRADCDRRLMRFIEGHRTSPAAVPTLERRQTGALVLVSHDTPFNHQPFPVHRFNEAISATKAIIPLYLKVLSLLC